MGSNLLFAFTLQLGFAPRKAHRFCPHGVCLNRSPLIMWVGRVGVDTAGCGTLPAV